MKISTNYLVKISAIISTIILTTFSISCASRSPKNVVILYTNDVHGHFCEENKIDYSNLKCMKDDLIQEGNDVLLLDAGDHLSGCINGFFDKGTTILKTMNDVGYDAVTLGNHEFDFGMEYLKDYTKKQNFSYLCTNLYNLNNGQLSGRVVEPSKIFNLQNQKIGVVGISTPDTIGVCPPKIFQNDNKEFIYSFLSDDTGDTLYNNVQNEVNALKNQGCKYVIALSHLGYNKGKEDYRFSSPALIAHTSGIDVLIDGHTHNFYIDDVFKNKDGKDVYCTQSGSFFDNVGKINISTDGKISVSAINSYDKCDLTIKNNLINYLALIERKYGETIATSDYEFKMKDQAGTNLIDLAADAYYYNALNAMEDVNTGSDVIAFTNTAAFKSGVEPGNWSTKTCLTVFPFSNHFLVRKMKGSVIETALEFGVKNILPTSQGEGETIIFPAGLKCQVDLNVQTEFDMDGINYVSGPKYGKRRTKNIKVYNVISNNWDDLDLTKYYYVGGIDYLIENGGDGNTMFSSADITTVYDGTDISNDNLDYQVLSKYLLTFDKSGTEYPKISTETSYFYGMDNYDLNYNDKEGSRRFYIIQPN